MEKQDSTMDILSPVLDDLSSTLEATQNIDTGLNIALNAATDFLKAQRGFILLKDPETGQMVPRAAKNLDPESILTTAEVSQTILHRVAEHGEPLVTQDAISDPRFSDTTSVVLSGLRSILCVPLRSKDQVVGLMYVDNRMKAGAYKRVHLDIFCAFAEKVGKFLKLG